MHALCMLDNQVKNIDTHSEIVILISYIQQKLLHERASILRYTNIACVI
jgi:methyl coenzyme M reductase subunit C